MTTAWEVNSEWPAMANNASRHNLLMTLVDNPIPLVEVAVSRQHSLQLRQAAAGAAEDSNHSKERVFK